MWTMDVSEPAADAEPEINTLCQAFLEVLGRFVDPRNNREEHQEAVAAAWDNLSNWIIETMLSLSPTALAAAYPEIIRGVTMMMARGEPRPPLAPS